eukprot:scaffold64563_cov30-Phaeocystis_antarctica.AAC.1
MCAMCDELTRDPIEAKPPACSIGVQLDTAAISPAARQRRAQETAKLAGWLATGWCACAAGVRLPELRRDAARRHTLPRRRGSGAGAEAGGSATAGG